MAKPIPATPVLRGKSAFEFVQQMIKTQNRTQLTKKERELFQLMFEGDSIHP